MDIPHNPAVFPSDERISGEHVAEYLEGSNLPEVFEATKEKILSDFN
jgi:large subunit ribosomal protein L18